MRRIGLLGTVGLACWISAGILYTLTHWNAPTLSLRGLGAYIGLLIAASTATIAQVIVRRDEPHVPAQLGYDLGWQQGYRTAQAENREEEKEGDDPPQD